MCTGRNKMHVSVPSLNFHVASYAPHASKYIKAKCPLLSIIVHYCPLLSDFPPSSSRVAASEHTNVVKLMELLLSFIAAKRHT